MRRKLSFILAAAMLAGSMTISAFAADNTTTFTDVTDSTQYSKAILTLVNLGVINGYEENGVKTFKPEGEITRAEFTAIITRAMGMAENAGGVSAFTDIDSHWAKNNIIAAADRKIVNGFEDNTFRPDEKVTYEQAVKMIVCALNYTNTAEAMGGWPDGYMNQGAAIGLLKDIAAGVMRTAPASRGVVAQLMYNALDIDVADIKTSIASDDTFLNKFLNMDMITGTIVGVEDSVTSECPQTLSRDEMAVKLKNGEIVYIDFEGYADSTTVASYLGYEAFIIYRMASGGGMNQLVVLNSEVTKNDITEVMYYDINSYKNGSLEYYNANGRNAHIDFDTNTATVFYNGKAVTSNVATKVDGWLNPSDTDFIYGTVKLTDSRADGSVDMVEIMDYDYMVATRTPSTSDYKLINKMKFKDKTKVERVITDDLVLNVEKSNPQITMTDTKGAAIQPSGIKANSVVLIAESESGDAYTVKVSSDKVSGRVQSYSPNEGLVKIEGKEYRITDDCMYYLSLDEQGTPIENGVNGDFYLDAMGAVAYATVTENSSTSTTVYMITAIYNEEDDTGSVRVFVPGSGYKTYTMADKMKIDGKSISAADAVDYLQDNAVKFSDTAVYGTGMNASNANQVAKLELDGAVVKDIITIDTTATPGTVKDLTKLAMFTSGPKTYTYSATNTFSEKSDTTKKFFVKSDTVYIYVPLDRKETKSYQKKNIGYFTKNGNYTIEAYNVDESNIAGIVVIYAKSAQSNNISNSTPISFLSEAPSDSLSGDEVLKKLTFFRNSDTTQSVNVDTAENVNGWQTGDVFQFVTSNEGNAVDLKVRISYNDIKTELAKDCDWTGSKFEYETTTKRTDGSGLPYGTAYVYNVIEATTTSGIFVTRSGFDTSGELVADAETVLIQVNSDTKYIKMSENGNKMLSKDEESGKAITIDDLRGSKYDRNGCSKVVITTLKDEYAKVIAIYE